MLSRMQTERLGCLPCLLAAGYLQGICGAWCHVSSFLCRSASALLSTLDVAAKARTAIDTALKALAKNGCAEDADAAEAAASAAEQGSSPLLQDDVAAARSTVASWRAATAAEARLERLLRDGTTPGTLSRVIQVHTALLACCMMVVEVHRKGSEHGAWH